jgi:hypothetical protein
VTADRSDTKCYRYCLSTEVVVITEPEQKWYRKEFISGNDRDILPPGNTRAINIYTVLDNYLNRVRYQPKGTSLRVFWTDREEMGNRGRHG